MNTIEDNVKGLAELGVTDKNENERIDSDVLNSPNIVSQTPQKTLQHNHKVLEDVVEVKNPSKVGEGISSYIVYQVNYQRDNNQFSVNRRFSDFLGLHSKLVEKYLPNGVIIPPVPDKDVLGTTKLMISKGGSVEMEFVERRRFALERFLRNILAHPVLKQDSDVQQFLEFSGDLPKATNTQLLSSASAKKVFKSFGDAIGKMGNKLEECDEYFYMKAEELESWDQELKRLHGALLCLTTDSRNLTSSKYEMSRCISALANTEEHTGMAQALSRLAETEERASELYGSQYEAEYVYLVQCAHEALGMIQACKNVLEERSKAYRLWKNAEEALSTKRAHKMRLEISGKLDDKKAQLAESEVKILETRVEERQTHFEQISNNIKKELENFNVTRFENFKRSAKAYLEVMLQTQAKLLELWETYLEQAKAIN